MELVILIRSIVAFRMHTNFVQEKVEHHSIIRKNSIKSEVAEKYIQHTIEFPKDFRFD